MPVVRRLFCGPAQNSKAVNPFAENTDGQDQGVAGTKEHYRIGAVAVSDK